MPTASLCAWHSRSALRAARSWHKGQQLWQYRASWRRGPGCVAYSSSLAVDAEYDSFQIPCGSAGTVAVDIFHRSLLANPSTPLIIYLPPTSVQLRHLSPATFPTLLSNSSPANSILGKLPIAQINYRWNIPDDATLDISQPPGFVSYPFPTPLHDTLYAYTWLTTSFLPSLNPIQNSSSSPRRSPSPYASASQAVQRSSLRPLLIYGSFLGGTLASSLSLTETQTRPIGVGVSIEGAIVRNAIFDWTQVATSRPPNSSDQSPIPSGSDIWDINTLHTLKSKLFPLPASAFEPFASPLLFFRSAGFSIPSYFPGMAPPPGPSIAQDPAMLDGLSISEEELASLRAAAPNFPPFTPKSEQDEEVTVERKSALRFPPKDSGLRIPRSLLLTTSLTQGGAGTATKKRRGAKAEQQKPGEEMRRQAEEMAKLMRRSVVMHEFKDRALWDQDGDPHALSEERVQVQEVSMEATGERSELDIIEEWVDGLGLEIEL